MCVTSGVSWTSAMVMPGVTTSPIARRGFTSIHMRVNLRPDSLWDEGPSRSRMAPKGRPYRRDVSNQTGAQRYESSSPVRGRFAQFQPLRILNTHWPCPHSDDNLAYQARSLLLPFLWQGRCALSHYHRPLISDMVPSLSIAFHFLLSQKRHDAVRQHIGQFIDLRLPVGAHLSSPVFRRKPQSAHDRGWVWIEPNDHLRP